MRMTILVFLCLFLSVIYCSSNYQVQIIHILFSCKSRYKWDISNEDLLNGNYDDRLYVEILNKSMLPFNHLIQNKKAGVYGVIAGPLICVESKYCI